MLSRWRKPSKVVVRSPIEIEPVRLYGSPFAWLGGVLWVGLSLSIVAGLIIAADFAATSPSGARGAMLCGVVLATPGAFMLGWVMLVAGVRLLRPRRGLIVFEVERLVISDRWMLSKPMAIERRDVRGIERLERLGFAQYTAYAGEDGRELGASGSLLDWATRPNFRIDLVRKRQFLEAIRTFRSKTPLQPISRYHSGDAVLIRVVDPDAADAKFDLWLSEPGDKPRPQSAPETRQSDPVHFGWLLFFLMVGFVVFCLGSIP